MQGNDSYITRNSTLQISVNDYNVTMLYNPLTVYNGSSTAIYLLVYPYLGIKPTNMTVENVAGNPSCITLGYAGGAVTSPGSFMLGPSPGYSDLTMPVAAAANCQLTNYQVTIKFTGFGNRTTLFDKLLKFTVSVQQNPCSPGCGGSLAAGTLITMADGATKPVQNVQTGDQVMSWGIQCQCTLISTVTSTATVTVTNQVTFALLDGTTITTDNATIQRFYVLQPNGTIGYVSVPLIQPGEFFFQVKTRTWVEITGRQYTGGGGQSYTMYDIYTAFPFNYIANGYVDPVKT
jgi:hypothetical protein